MLGGAQIVPFAPLPKKSWKHGAEKKERLPIDLTSEVSSADEDEDEYSEEDSDSEDDYYDDYDDSGRRNLNTASTQQETADNDEEYFDLQKHIESLLPGEIGEDGKPRKGAGGLDLYLDDLRKKKPNRDRLKYVKYFYRVAVRWRRQERERRKHYLLKEFEERIRVYDEMQKQLIRSKMIEHQKEVLMEAHRRRKRIERNSKKKTNQKLLIENFTADLERRDKENKLINFYSKNLTDWAIEGKNRREEEEEEERQRQLIRDKEAMEAAKEAARVQLIVEDAAILEEDKAITAEVQTIMLKAGTIGYESKEHETDNDKVTDIFQKSKNAQLRASTQLDAQAALQKALAAESSENSTRLVLNVKKGIDTVTMKKKLNRNVHRRVQDASIGTPFKEDLSGTGHITTLKAVSIGETGALSFAAELTRGACPMLQILNLKNCEVKSAGVGRIFQGLKTANLLTLRVLNLRANHIQPLGLEYMREVCAAGLFLNLEVLNLAENELGDEGIDALIRMIIQGHLTGIQYIDMQHNSITDIGFSKTVKVMKSLAEAKCPELQRFRVENNLVTGKAKRQHAPYPHFLSC